MDELGQIKDRNARVEADKAWETSWTRRSIIAVGTYFIIGFYLKTLGVVSPWLHALVPAMAYVISTLTLSFFKTLWINKIFRNNRLK